MDRNFLQNQYNSQIRIIRKIIKSWNLIPGAPSDEFDPLAHKLLKHLSERAYSTKISEIIASDLVIRYGFLNHEIDPESFANEIMDWWYD
ncbi:MULTISPECIES: hypothetical protein [Sphingobacterium]|uniref:Uncharacterized protein n=1 Tax=Sphingobacterium ginsenosidimutans TaxID=687845 RepID=A0ABP7ZPG3_9SPHI|nr:hypothetical protein [Sphingobacterium sp. E70]ULT26503.1 hypothetical protein KUH03_06465 [Sphingobacterium sp. E70]